MFGQWWIFVRREIRGKMGDFFDQAQKYHRTGAHQQAPAGLDGNACRLLARLHEILCAPNRHDSCCPIFDLLADPILIGAKVGGTVDTARGIEIRCFHDRETAMQADFVQLDTDSPLAVTRMSPDILKSEGWRADEALANPVRSGRKQP